MDQPLSVDTSKIAEPTPLGVDTGDTSPPLPDDTLTKRANKYQFGMAGIVDLDTNDIKAQLANNQEHDLRQFAAAKVDSEKKSKMKDLLQQNYPATWYQQYLQPTAPNSVFEMAYGKQYVNYLDKSTQDIQGNLWQSIKEDPDAWEKAKEGGSAFHAMQEVVQKEFENRKAAYEAQSYPGYGIDVAKSLIPFYYEQRQTIALGQGLSILPGKSIEEGIENMMLLPLPEFTDKLHTMLEGMDPTMAFEMIKKFKGYSSSDQGMDNFFGAIDLSTLSALKGVGKAAIVGGEALKRKVIMDRAIKQMAESVPDVETKPAKIVANEASGNIKEAAILRATAQVTSGLTGAGNPITEALEALPEALQVSSDKLRSGPGSTELVNRIAESSDTTTYKLKNIIANWSRVLRTQAPLSTEQGIRVLEKEISRDYPGMDNQILNINIWRHPVTNALFYDLKMGAPGGVLFDTEESARNFLEYSSLKGLNFTPEQQGAGWYLNIRRPQSEITNGMRDGLLTTKDSTTPIGWANRLFNLIRTPDETLSTDQNMARKTAVYAPGAIFKLVRDSFKETERLIGGKSFLPWKKQQLEDWKKVTDAIELAKDPVTGLPPLEVETVGDYQQFFMKSIGKLPTDRQTAAYFELKKAHNLDHFFRNLGIYTLKSRIGTENWGFSFKIGDELMASPRFDAIARQQVSIGKDSVIMVVDDVGKIHPELTEPPTTPAGPTPSGEPRVQELKDKFWADSVMAKRPRDQGIGAGPVNPDAPEKTKTLDERYREEVTEPQEEAAPSVEQNEHARRNMERAAWANPMENINAAFEDIGSLDKIISADSVKKARARLNVVHQQIFAAARQRGLLTRDLADEDSAADIFLKNAYEKGEALKEVIESEEHQPLAAAIDSYKTSLDALSRATDLITKPVERESRINFKSAGAVRDRTASPREAIPQQFQRQESGPAPAKAEVNKSPFSFHNVQEFGSTQWKHYEDLVKKGTYRLLEVFSPEHRPLKGFAGIEGQYIRYILVKNSDQRPLSYSQVPRKGGRHLDYDYEHYIKQGNVVFDPILKKYRYEGDITVMPISNNAMGQQIVKHLDAARELIDKNKWDEAQTYVGKNLHIPWKDFKSWFTDQHDPNGNLIPARLSTKERFGVASRDKLLMDKDPYKEHYETKYPNIIDGTKSGSLNKQYQVQYTGQRDSWEVHTLNDVGSKGNPLYQYQPAKLVDPITSMNRALTRIVNSTWADDYKISAIEHWLEEARPLLKYSKEEIRSAPFYHFFNAENSFIPDADPLIKNHLMANHFKIRQFAGIRTHYDTIMEAASQKLADSVYEKYGPKGEIIPTWAMAHTKDPIAFLRSRVFNMKLGYLNPAQFFVHAMTVANVFGIAGMKGIEGAAAAFLHGLYAINPEMLEHLDSKIASKMGWAPGDFKDSLEHLHATSFMDEHGEHAMKDFNESTLRTWWDKMEEFGQIPFRSGVATLRSVSWFTAYREFRALHPTGLITEADRQRILNRADLLSHNMSRASSSVLHTGVMTIPTQFYTYFLRLTELMLGHRLTGIEKMRLMGVNVALFGFPTSLALFGSPFETQIRQAVKTPSSVNPSGYIPGESWWQTIAMEGLLGWATGKNPGQRYGPEGFGTLAEIVNDKPFWQVMGGASTTTVVNTVKGMSGFLGWTMDNIANLGNGRRLTNADWLDMFNEISSVAAARRFWAGVKYHEWRNKNEEKITDVDTPNAIINFFTGLQPIEAADAWGQQMAIQGMKDQEKHMAQTFIKEMRRAMRAAQDGDEGNFQAYSQKAWTAAANYPHERLPELLSEAWTGHEDLLTRLDKEQFFSKFIPEDQRPAMNDYYERKLKMRQK